MKHLTKYLSLEYWKLRHKLAQLHKMHARAYTARSHIPYMGNTDNKLYEYYHDLVEHYQEEILSTYEQLNRY